jgi:hypothetical protein
LEIGTVTKTVFDETKDVIITWFGVLSQGEPAFASLDLATNSALLFALRFLFYISLADFAVSIPSSAANGVQNENRMFIGVSIASIYVEYLAFSLIIYGTMKLLGGKAPVQACIAGYCFLTADLPVAAVLRLPLVPIIDAALKAGANYPDIASRGAALFVRLSTWDKLVFVLASLLSVGVFGFFVINVYRCFRRLHQLSLGRAPLAFALGLLVALLFTMAVIVPFDGATSRAFAVK